MAMAEATWWWLGYGSLGVAWPGVIGGVICRGVSRKNEKRKHTGGGWLDHKQDAIIVSQLHVTLDGQWRESCVSAVCTLAVCQIDILHHPHHRASRIHHLTMTTTNDDNRRLDEQQPSTIRIACTNPRSTPRRFATSSLTLYRCLLLSLPRDCTQF